MLFKLLGTRKTETATTTTRQTLIIMIIIPPDQHHHLHAYAHYHDDYYYAVSSISLSIICCCGWGWGRCVCCCDFLCFNSLVACSHVSWCASHNNNNKKTKCIFQSHTKVKEIITHHVYVYRSFSFVVLYFVVGLSAPVIYNKK